MLTTILLSSLAFAQSPEEPNNLPPNTQYAKKTIVDMTGTEVDGVLVGPQVSFVSDWKPSHEGSLIRLRTSFGVEMNQSISDIK
jgi:hypothetical protein